MTEYFFFLAYLAINCTSFYPALLHYTFCFWIALIYFCHNWTSFTRLTLYFIAITLKLLTNLADQIMSSTLYFAGPHWIVFLYISYNSISLPLRFPISMICHSIYHSFSFFPFIPLLSTILVISIDSIKDTYATLRPIVLSITLPPIRQFSIL